MYQSPAKVAKLIGKSRNWVINRCKEHQLPYIYKNGRYLINTAKLIDALEFLEEESFGKRYQHISTKPVENYLYN